MESSYPCKSHLKIREIRVSTQSRQNNSMEEVKAGADGLVAREHFPFLPLLANTIAIITGWERESIVTLDRRC